MYVSATDFDFFLESNAHFMATHQNRCAKPKHYLQAIKLLQVAEGL